jgi:hypothetical protein
MHGHGPGPQREPPSRPAGPPCPQPACNKAGVPGPRHRSSALRDPPALPAPPSLDSACTGDSGGPLVFNSYHTSSPLAGSPLDDVVVGSTSWGVACGLADLPSVFARLPTYKAWFDEQLAVSEGPGRGGGSGPAPPTAPAAAALPRLGAPGLVCLSA